MEVGFNFFYFKLHRFIIILCYTIFFTTLLFAVKYIKNMDGFTGCYRGLVPKVCSYTVSTIAYDKTLEYLQPNLVEQNEDEDDEDESVRCVLKKGRKISIANINFLIFYRRKRCMNEIIKDVISRTAAIIVSHPLEVISLRMMAQFVGGETKYRYHKYVAS